MYVTPNCVRHHLRLEGAVLHPGHDECGLPGSPLGFLVTHLGGTDSVRQIQIQHSKYKSGNVRNPEIYQRRKYKKSEEQIWIN